MDNANQADDAGTVDTTGEQLRAIVNEAVNEAVRTSITPDALRGIMPAAEPAIVTPPSNPTRALPVNVKRFGSVRNFTGADADVKAYRFGMWCIAAISGARFAKEYCAANDIPVRFVEDNTRGHKESNNESGGYLVPDEFGNDLIDLREKYGAFRRNAKIVPMASDTRSDPRRTGGLTAYWESESNAGTESTKGWDRVGLTAKKMMALARYSNELNEDAVINIGDDLAGEIAYAFELKTDQSGFVGDGSSTYGGIKGVAQRLIDVYTTSGGVGLILGAGNAMSELTLANHHSVVAALPEYADNGSAKWYASRFYYYNVMQRLALAAGGATADSILNGTTRSFLGYPVEIVQVMPKTDANSQVVATFGDLRAAASLGDRRQMTVRFSEHALNAFENDEIIIRGTQRLDINVHDVGSSTEAGPIVGLITAAS